MAEVDLRRLQPCSKILLWYLLEGQLWSLVRGCTQQRLSQAEKGRPGRMAEVAKEELEAELWIETVDQTVDRTPNKEAFRLQGVTPKQGLTPWTQGRRTNRRWTLVLSTT